MQVPAHVEYEKATSVEHALALLVRYGPDARILAGGHSLIPMMKLRLVQPETLIDINGLSDLSFITETGGELRIGALTRHAQLLESPAAGRHFAILNDAEKVMAGQIAAEHCTPSSDQRGPADYKRHLASELTTRALRLALRRARRPGAPAGMTPGRPA